MHNIANVHVNGGIDGTIKCDCGWQKRTNYPGRGWGRKSVGIRRSPGQTKGQWINNRLVTMWAKHADK